MSTEDLKQRNREFDVLTARCGIEVPADRRSGAFAVYLELTRLAERLHEPRDAASEPSYIFSLPAILRGG